MSTVVVKKPRTTVVKMPKTTMQSKESPTSMSKLDFFSQWASYSSWADLKVWLQENEPTINIVETDDSPYVILRNSKEKDLDLPPTNEDAMSEAAQLCRSVIWDTRSNRPCSVAPFAARRDQKTPMNTDLRVEDFVEGVMINVFRSQNDKETHVCTRSRLDADGCFYSERSFRELFEEAMDAKKTSLDFIEHLMGQPEGNVSATFMTLVLAHPEHRVVRSVDTANLWAIYRGNVYNDGTVEFFTDDLPVSWRPKMYSDTFKAKSWMDLKNKFEEIKATKPWYWQGLVVHTGLQRWRFRNADHDRVRRDLRGTESNSFARFLRLRANKRVQEYLRIYTEDNDSFQEFESEYRAATKTLYAWYCRCHKEHSVVFKEMPKSVQPLIFDLHKFYLASLRPVNKSLHLTEVITWISEHLKTPYGISNLLRFTKETEQPPESKTTWPKDVDAPVDAAVDAAVEECSGACEGCPEGGC